MSVTFNIYRKEKNDLNPPTAIATGLTGKEFEDTTLSKDTAYLASVSAKKGSIEKFSDELLVYMASEHENPEYLLAELRTHKFDWSKSSSDYQAIITADTSWKADDYVVFASYSRSVTVTPPSGISLLYTKQHASIANAWLHVFGGVKGLATTFAFDYATAIGGSCFAINALAIGNIDMLEDVVLSDQNSMYFNGNIVEENTDGLYLVSTFGFEVSSIGVDFSPSTNNEKKFVYSTAVGVRGNYLYVNATHEKLSLAKTYGFSTTATQDLEIATLVLKRKVGTRTPITYDKSGLHSQISSSKGFAYAFMKDGEIVETVVGGVEKTGGNAFTANTVFPLASLSKLITELAVRKLAEDGLLTLDDPIGQHLVGYTLGTNVANITIRNLLEMKSGINTGFNLLNTDWQQETRNWLSNSSANRGWRYIYDNGCFATIQLIIDVVAESYIDYVQENIFKKLGIRDVTHDLTSLTMKMYSTSLSEADMLDIRATAAAGWCMSLNSFSKIAKTLRYSIILNNQNKMKEERYRMIPIVSLRGEMFNHNGALTDGNGRGISGQYTHGCDGYDVIALTNTYLASNMIASCLNALS